MGYLRELQRLLLPIVSIYNIVILVALYISSIESRAARPAEMTAAYIVILIVGAVLFSDHSKAFEFTFKRRSIIRKASLIAAYVFFRMLVMYSGTLRVNPAVASTCLLWAVLLLFVYLLVHPPSLTLQYTRPGRIALIPALAAIGSLAVAAATHLPPPSTAFLMDVSTVTLLWAGKAVTRVRPAALPLVLVMQVALFAGLGAVVGPWWGVASASAVVGPALALPCAVQLLERYRRAEVAQHCDEIQLSGLKGKFD